MPLFSVFQSPGVLTALTGTEIPLVLSGAAGQSVPYFEIRDHSGALVLKVSPSGVYVAGNLSVGDGEYGGNILKSAVPNSAYAVGNILDTQETYFISGSKLLSVRNAGIEKFFIDKDGNISSSGTFIVSGSTIMGDQIIYGNVSAYSGTFSGDIRATGNVGASGNLRVSGSTFLNGPVTLSSSLSSALDLFARSGTLSGDLQVDGTTSLANGSVVVSSADQQVIFTGGAGTNTGSLTLQISPDSGGTLKFQNSSGETVLVMNAEGGLSGSNDIDISPRTRTFTVACDTSLVVGDLVFLPPTGSAVRADGGNGSLMPSAGMVIQKPTAGTAIVQVNGMVNDVFSGLVRGAVYYVGNDGRISPNPPAGSAGSQVFSQRIGIAASSNSLILMVSPDVFVFYR